MSNGLTSTKGGYPVPGKYDSQPFKMWRNPVTCVMDGLDLPIGLCCKSQWIVSIVAWLNCHLSKIAVCGENLLCMLINQKKSGTFFYFITFFIISCLVFTKLRQWHLDLWVHKFRCFLSYYCCLVDFLLCIVSQNPSYDYEWDSDAALIVGAANTRVLLIHFTWFDIQANWFTNLVMEWIKLVR